ncbi:hypothetical protein LPJ61_003587 [Coemansia biformis]|uniref:Ribosome biogenesis protein NOP53 n=1 Tax=Coemansia biformis TaxID=1286918 RepID=A0A9W7YBW4_9FUNG|nr:hypothetical protein LPJ61_003587 [Coemansia biformis]
MSAVAKAPSAGGAPRKTRGGRKGKSAAWRKDIDLADVEAGLEERREEEKQGGAVVEKRQDSELFMMDIAGDDKTRARVASQRGLRVDEILGRRSKVAVPVLGSKMGEERKRKRAELALKRRLGKVAGFVGKRRVAPEGIRMGAAAQDLDIWGAGGTAAAAPSTKPKVAMSRKRLAHLAELPAVEVAHPGASYRPTKQAHAELVAKAGAEYAAEIRNEGKCDEFKGFRGVQAVDGAIECAEFVMEEMTQGDAAADSDGDSDGSDTVRGSADEGGPRRTKAPRAKTRVDRNRQRRATQRLGEERKAKVLKQRLHELDMSARFSTGVDARAAASDLAAERTRRQAQEKATQPLKRLGKYDVPQLPEAVKLTEDLPVSLRELEPETNSFADTFNSLVKRNLVEPRIPFRPKTKPRRAKTTEKWAYKDFV